jgi:pyruvyltransferase
VHGGAASTAFWWRARPNWGDALTPLLLDRLAGIDVEWAPPDQAQMVVTGSILDLLPAGWSGTVLGTGKLHERTKLDLGAANVIALRGPMSAVGVQGDFALGDPALLCSEFVPVPTERHELVVVPHWSDRHLAKRFAHVVSPDGIPPYVIAPSADPLTVIGHIAAARKVVSASLHGIIVADAFHIPRRAVQFPNIAHRYEGRTFKYDDYARSLGEPRMQFEELHTPNPAAIDRVQAELFDAFRSLSVRV